MEDGFYMAIGGTFQGLWAGADLAGGGGLPFDCFAAIVQAHDCDGYWRDHPRPTKHPLEK
ncbi:hypothetical protein DI396_01065 [Litorivita pollutaquae]|uniref:Uncharacterized protein n=2 Tax=Litorivita pollutaquae TaxID=2200892 RepID=A0A2V4MPT1_9RHOB|nr:hypothetical protein DI396_01065 [Litorivita pollutaquae]